jgi:hypothetical protein
MKSIDMTEKEESSLIQDSKDLLAPPLPRKSFTLENKTIVEDSTATAVDEILKNLKKLN